MNIKKIGTNNKLYAAYGSNLNLEQMERRCPYAVPVGSAQLPGYRLLFQGGKESSVATVEPFEDSSVPVLLWEITPRCEEALDHYEGWPRLYRKEILTFSMCEKPVQAMVYIMNDGRRIGTPGQYYYNAIAEGYATAGFDLDILDDAVAVFERLSKTERHGDCLLCSNSFYLEDDFDYGTDRLFCEITQGFVEEHDCCVEFK